MNKKNSIDSTGWQNPKFPPIPTELVLLDSKDEETGFNVVRSYLYNGHKINAKDAIAFHETIDFDTFIISVGLN